MRKNSDWESYSSALENSQIKFVKTTAPFLLERIYCHEATGKK